MFKGLVAACRLRSHKKKRIRKKNITRVNKLVKYLLKNTNIDEVD